MTTAEQQFEHAVKTMHASPFSKLVKPGILRFLVRRWQRWQGDGTRREARLFFGETMQVVLPEVVSEVIYTYGFFDEEVTRMVMDSVRPGDTVLDVGGHFGYVSLLCRHLAGEEGRVIAFEPTPSTFAILSENLSRYRNAEAINVGMGRTPGELSIRDYGLRFCAWNTLADDTRMPDVLAGVEPALHQVKIVCLDDVVAERGIAPDFIKVDAENFEYDVIAGAMDSIRRHQPTVLLETGSESSLRAGELLLECGYEVHVCEVGGRTRRWEGSLPAANERYKDLLFIHASRH